MQHASITSGSGFSATPVALLVIDSLCIPTQALRARLLSTCPSGTKAIRPSKRHTIILTLMPEPQGACGPEGRPNTAARSIPKISFFKADKRPKSLLDFAHQQRLAISGAKNTASVQRA